MYKAPQLSSSPLSQPTVVEGGLLENSHSLGGYLFLLVQSVQELKHYCPWLSSPCSWFPQRSFNAYLLSNHHGDGPCDQSSQCTAGKTEAVEQNPLARSPSQTGSQMESQQTHLQVLLPVSSVRMSMNHTLLPKSRRLPSLVSIFILTLLVIRLGSPTQRERTDIGSGCGQRAIPGQGRSCLHYPLPLPVRKAPF